VPGIVYSPVIVFGRMILRMEIIQNGSCYSKLVISYCRIDGIIEISKKYDLLIEYQLFNETEFSVLDSLVYEILKHGPEIKID